LGLQEQRKTFEKFSNVKQLLWRKNKRRGFFEKKNAPAFMANQSKYELFCSSSLRSHATEKFDRGKRLKSYAL
jgi:hypothetical protein